jgi:hypothetical protein
LRPALRPAATAAGTERFAATCGERARVKGNAGESSTTIRREIEDFREDLNGAETRPRAQDCCARFALVLIKKYDCLNA